MKAAILAGGFGKRLRPLTSEKPKPLVEVAGKPILEWQIEWLKAYGIREFVLLVGYLKEKVINHIGSGARLGVKVSYVVEEEPLGTGGAIKNAEHILSGEQVFIVVNGDVITNLDPRRLIEPVVKGEVAASIAAVPLRSPYGILKIREDNRIESFIEKPLLRDYWINAGVYAMSPQVFSYLPESGDIEKTGFPELAKKGLLKAVKYENVVWRSIDTHKDIEEASKELESLGRWP